MSNLYKLNITSSKGTILEMGDFRNRYILIVNTATQCGFTSQFKGLEKIHQVYKNNGLVVLGFPSNQFANQEPLNNEEMVDSCRINHGVTFQLTKKIDVNGENTHPIYVYLKSQTSSLFGSKIKWNFTKFLISPNGIVLKRYAPTVKPSKIEKDIKKLYDKDSLNYQTSNR